MAIGTEAATGSHDEPTMVDQARETTEKARERAGEGIRQQLETGASKAGSQVAALTDALRRTGQQLRTEGKPQPAGMVDRIADRGERLGGYLENLEPERVLHDLEGLARRQPWLVTGLAFTGGLVASRFLKASSEHRYASGGARPTGPTYAPTTLGGQAAETRRPEAPAALPEAAPVTSIPGTTL